MKMETSNSLNYDRRYFSRQPSFDRRHHHHQHHQPHTPPPIAIDSHSHNQPFLSRSVSSIDIPPPPPHSGPAPDAPLLDQPNFSVISLLRILRSGNNKPLNKLFIMISLNFAYSTSELLLGLFTGRIGLVSDAFHLTFGCGLLTFSLFAMAVSRRQPDPLYTYGFKRLEVLSAFTNALFLLFLSFSLAVEALHAFIQDESEHKHYLIVSAVTNLLVNLIGVWFFRNYARINLAYRKAEDMNYHSVCLHVLADSIRSAGLILASWFLALGVQNAEVLCLGLVSIAIFMLVMPLFKTTGGILLQMAPPSIPSSALSKCMRQILSHEDVVELSQARFWEFVPGHVVGSLSVQVKSGINDSKVLHFVHDLYHELGIQEVSVEIQDV